LNPERNMEEGPHPSSPTANSQFIADTEHLLNFARVEYETLCFDA